MSFFCQSFAVGTGTLAFTSSMAATYITSEHVRGDKQVASEARLSSASDSDYPRAAVALPPVKAGCQPDVHDITQPAVDTFCAINFSR